MFISKKATLGLGDFIVIISPTLDNSYQILIGHHENCTSSAAILNSGEGILRG